MPKWRKPTRLPAPFLKVIELLPERVPDWNVYPFSLPLFRSREFSLSFERPITILAGENGTGKSTLLEAIAGIAGFDEAGGGKGYSPVDHDGAIDDSGTELADVFRAGWLPKIGTGWFFRAESFWTVARYLDGAALSSGKAPPDFLSHSHGEGFIRFFEERCRTQGLFIFDEPESALSPLRQIAFLKLLRDIGRTARAQVIMATHSPLLMACPDATLLRLSRHGLEPARLDDIEHFRILREFFLSPQVFIDSMLDE